ncbi:hypothetical protein IV203_027812 [Nitzschia inconspicua]|uniref:Uncharacterized protein n=1 Tax=Nitzschia inconspicua TaxID=303405 RepID=A0A9K3M0L1_9STRA|nr:hypothetical protein IV203_027812 [Nitzschia inconspicua]
MKFLAIALAALTGFSEAKKVVNKSELNRRLKNGLVNKATLMAGAKPANEFTKRKLEENGFEINGDYSIQFDHCLSLTIQNQELWNDGNFVDMAANGDLISEKDYIIFNVCETAYCSYYANDEKMTFIADVGTYFQAISQYLPNKVQEYCEACERNYDYCYAQYSGQQYYPEGYEPAQEEEQAGEEEEEQAAEEGAEEGEQAAEENQEGGRKLQQNGQIVKFIDCQMCADYECLDFQQSDATGFYDDNGDFVEAELDDAIEWLNGFSECAETYAYLDDYLLYSGLMCNADGDGLEIGLFLDDDCLMYTPKVAYKDVMQTADETYYGMIYDVMEFTFTNDGIECYDPEVVWYNEVDYSYQQQNGEQQQQQQQDEDNGEAPEAAEWCRELVKDNAAVNLYDCDGYAPDENGGDEGDDHVGTYGWYSYELKAEDSEDIQAVCYIVQNLQGEHHTSFNSGHTGLFDYKKNKKNTSSGMSGGGIAGIVILVLALVGAVAGGMFFLKKQDNADKKKPLINEEGQLA